MSALTAARNTPERANTPEKSHPVAASVLCYAGGMACIDGNGRTKPAVTATGLYGCGRFEAEADNSSGAAGAINARVREGVFRWGNSAAGDAIAIADRGKPCYMVDDQTVALTDGGGTRSPAGRIEDVDSDGVWVAMSVQIGKQLTEEAGATSDDLIFDAATELTIAGGVVTATQGYHTIDTQNDDASDDLDTINGMTAGEIVVIRAASAARTVVLKHNTGNIFNPYGEDISLAEATDGVMLFYNGTKVIPIAVSLLAKGGGLLGAALASVANGKGASLVGVEDSAGKITATNVEAALAEIAADGWFSADAAGRAHMATGYFNAAKVADAFGTDSFTAAVLLQLIQNGAFAADADTRALFADGIWTTAKLAAGILSADVTGRALVAADFFNAATVDDKFAADAIGEDILTANELTGRVVGNTADDGVVGAIPVEFTFNISGGVTGNNDFVVTPKVEVVDVHFIKTNAAGDANDTVQLLVGGNAITNAVSLNVADKAIARAGTIDDAFSTIAAGATWRFTHTNGGGGASDTTCIAVVRGLRRA